MKKPAILYGYTLSLPVILTIFLLLSYSCEVRIEKTDSLDILTLPSLTGKDIHTVYSDSGTIQLIMSAPILETWENFGNPYTEFRQGMKIEFFEGQNEPVAYVIAKYAKYTDKQKLWELNDSVVVVNNAGDMLETEQLFWDEEKDHIFTEMFVKITNEDQTIMGTGFESDTRLKKRKIKNVTATIYVDDE